MLKKKTYIVLVQWVDNSANEVFYKPILSMYLLNKSDFILFNYTLYSFNAGYFKKETFLKFILSKSAQI